MVEDKVIAKSRFQTFQSSFTNDHCINNNCDKWWVNGKY